MPQASFRIAASQAATFARASVATKLDGSQVASGSPRYEAGQSGQAIMVEEGTTNLVPTARQLFATNWAGYLGAVPVLTQGQAVPAWGATDATRVQISGGTNVLKYYTSILIPSVNGTVYTNSLWVQNNGIAAITIKINLTGEVPVNIAPGEAKRVVITGTGNGSESLQLVLYTALVGNLVDAILWRPQSEAKAYVTSWISGTRAAETLTIPTSGVVAGNQGAIACWIKPNNNQPTNQLLFDSEPIGDPSLQIYRKANTNQIGVATTTLGSPLSVGDAPVNIWSHVAVSWGALGIKIYLNGVLDGSSSTPITGLLWGTNINIGGSAAGYKFTGLIIGLRSYNRMPTDTEVMRAYLGFPPPDFAALLPFDNSLELFASTENIQFSRNPLRPAFSLDKIQPRELSAVDVPIVYSSRATDDVFELPLRLTSAERALLEFFFLNIARGQSIPFTYTDAAGLARTVKFNQTTLPIKEIAYDSHTVTVSLRVQP